MIPDDAPWAHHFPLFLTPFVGRERELRLAADALEQDQTRLLTLAGPFGVGKTRLALAVAEEVRAAFPDDVWFVDLATEREPADLLTAVARGLGRRDGRRNVPTRSWLELRLRGRLLLVVLDSCEHLLAGASDLAGLLAGASGLTILATSREPLGLQSERTLRVRPLALRGVHEPPDLREIAATPAVRFFLQRAGSFDPDFALTPENAADVEALCRRLDGLPLALQAAAAQVRAFTPSTILARLTGPRVLRLSGREVGSGQRTLRDAVESSYRLLEATQQALLRRLSVCAASFGLEAAHAVASEEETEPADTLAGLIALVDKSLLQSELSSGGELRFRMLETIRAYAEEQLVAAGEDAAAKARHVGYFAHRAETRAEDGQLAEIGRDLPDLEAALEEAARQDLAPVALQLATAMAAFWREQGPWVADLPRGSTLLKPSRGADAGQRAGALLEKPPTDGWPLGSRLRAWTQRGGTGPDTGRFVVLQTLLGFEAWLESDQETAQHLFTRSLADARQAGDALGIADSLLGLANVAIDLGDYKRAVSALEEVGPRYRDLGESQGEVLALRGLAGVAVSRGDQAAAIRLYAAALELHQEDGPPRSAIPALEGAAVAAAECGQPTTAARLLGAARVRRERLASEYPARNRSLVESVVARVRLALSDDAFQAAFAAGRSAALPDLIAELRALGDEESVDREPAEDLPPAAAVPVLVDRERAVLALAANGMPTKTIARTLGLGERTIKGAVAAARSKLGAQNRAHAIVLAAQRGLLGEPVPA